MERLAPDSILASVPLHVFVLSPEGRIRYLNRASPGRTVAGVLGRDIREFLAPEDSKFFLAAMKRALDTKSAQALAVDVLDADGARRRYKYSLAPFEERGRATGLIGWALDITVDRGDAAERDAASRIRALTPRQRAVLSLVAQGHSNREIARRLGVGVRTVETHREQLSDKLGLRGVAALTRFALAARLI